MGPAEAKQWHLETQKEVLSQPCEPAAAEANEAAVAAPVLGDKCGTLVGTKVKTVSPYQTHSFLAALINI